MPTKYNFNPFTGKLDMVLDVESHTFTDLSDVTISTPSDKDDIWYNSTSGEWENGHHFVRLAGDTMTGNLTVEGADGIAVDPGSGNQGIYYIREDGTRRFAFFYNPANNKTGYARYDNAGDWLHYFMTFDRANGHITVFDGLVDGENYEWRFKGYPSGDSEQTLTLTHTADYTSITTTTGKFDFGDDDLQTIGNLTDGTNSLTVANAKDAYDKRVDTWGDGLEYSSQTASVDYNTTNLKITSGEINTIQDIDTTASPEFAGATINGDITDGTYGGDVEDLATANIAVVIPGGGSVISADTKIRLGVDFDCTIRQVTMYADQSGSIQVDVWKDTYANYPPTDADSITASAPLTISSSNKSQDSTLTGWTKTINAGDSIILNVDSCTTITECTILFKVTKT